MHIYRYNYFQIIIREVNDSKVKIIHDRCASFKKPIEQLIPNAQDTYDAVCIYVRVYMCIFRYIFSYTVKYIFFNKYIYKYIYRLLKECEVISKLIYINIFTFIHTNIFTHIFTYISKYTYIGTHDQKCKRKSWGFNKRITICYIC
jgi:hypothetical protein